LVEIPAGCNALTVCTTQTTVANETNGLTAPNDLVVAADAKLYITNRPTIKSLHFRGIAALELTEPKLQLVLT